MIHIDKKLMRGKASRTYVFCWVCMRVTGAKLWPVERRTRVMLLPFGRGEPQWNDVECENCKSLYKTDAYEEPPHSEADLPRAAVLIDRIRRSAITDDNRETLLVEILRDFQHMQLKRANDGRVETVTTLLSLVFIILLIMSFAFWYTYADPRARNPQLLFLASSFTAATIAMFALVAWRATKRNIMGLNRGVLDRIAIAANHLQPTEELIEAALDRLTQTSPRYAKDLRRAGLVERILNPCDTLRP